MSAPFATAFAPANISLVFETYKGSSPAETGSLGVGCTLAGGVHATVRPAKATQVLVNGEAWDFPTVRGVVDALAPAPCCVELTADFPFGCGFGMSGASALATAFSINKCFDLGRSRADLALVAHIAEVEHSTGLGDVGGQFNGGVMVKSRKFDPLVVESLIDEEPVIHVKIFGPILTSDIINSAERLADINRAGAESLKQITAKPLSLAELFDISRAFATESGLLQSEKLKDALAEIDELGGSGTMIMLGEAVVSTVPFTGSQACQITKHGVMVQ